MITRKDWNDLPELARKRAAQIVYFNMSPAFQEEMSKPWHHDADAWHKVLFKCLTLSPKKNSVKVVTQLFI